ncbi:hypothetical protein CROQUDRAFT_38837 [Cronartium quercuum f. sp. fusiforme G11]|uniref:Amine oxidase n=1 Tax=Cronartium quercuum f. sp. fusiforme G11 TaxID=708437 RepID=A0A9P6NMZ2_9BASI|nr:hypothetical protein CROQUDRAFT_38837 [Cronartium quercuum f. sp. fusiforme G11]
MKNNIREALDVDEFHPLDPLSFAEIDSAGAFAKHHLLSELKQPKVITTSVTLVEPHKQDVLLYIQSPHQKNRPKRKCELTAISLPSGTSYILTIEFPHDDPLHPIFHSPVQVLPTGTHLLISPEEIDVAEAIVRQDEHVQRLCKDVGVPVDQIACDGWAIGYDPDLSSTSPGRFQQCLMYVHICFCMPQNLYAHPLDFVPVVDTLTGKVVRIDFGPSRITSAGEDMVEGKLSSGTTAPGHIEAGTYVKDALERALDEKMIEEALKALNGNQLYWQNWKMHIGFNYREGLVLNTISYKDEGVYRPMFYRMSLVEMVVPYGSPEAPHNSKFAFDVGEYGLGNLANSLSLGCDCLGEIRYLDAINISNSGKANVVKNAICIHEEDAGLLWKHTDFKPGGRSYSVRSRKLVISFICTIGNYDYMFYWNFFQDGSISLDTKLTGILNLHVLAEGESTGGFGTEVAPRIVAQNHAHTFSLRIDPMIDGVKNSVVATDVVPLSYPTGSVENYLGNGFQAVKEVLKTTAKGAQDYDHAYDRSWTIINPVNNFSSECKNQPKLVPKKDSMIGKRAPFTKHDLFVTPYSPDQYYPSGKHVPGTTKAPEDSLENWLKGDKNIDNEDIVIYLTYGVNHLPTPEQFPIMSAEVLTVNFKPSGFFKNNPSLGEFQAQRDLILRLNS